MTKVNERIPFLRGILDFNFIFGSNLVLKFDNLINFSDIGQGSVYQNIDKIESVRTKEQELNTETHKTKRSILGDLSTPCVHWVYIVFLD